MWISFVLVHFVDDMVEKLSTTFVDYLRAYPPANEMVDKSSTINVDKKISKICPKSNQSFLCKKTGVPTFAQFGAVVHTICRFIHFFAVLTC